MSGVSTRLVELFPRAHWSRSAVHNNMPSLEKQRLVRLVARGAEPGLDRYEATEDGVARFQEWLSQSTRLPPSLRDAFQGRLPFVERDELATLIETVRQSEAAYRMEYSAAQGRVKAVTWSMRRSPASTDWRMKLRYVQCGDESMLLGMMFRRLQKLADELERLLEDEQPAAGHAAQE
jgi:hypothetical protein